MRLPGAVFLRKLDRGNAYPAPSIPGPLALRVLTIDGKPWFVVRDLCVALGICLNGASGEPNVTVATRGMGMSEFQYRLISFMNRGGSMSRRRVALVSERGLGKLTGRARVGRAANFLEWVDTVVFQRKRSEFPCVSRSSTVTNPTVNPIPGEIALPQTKGIIPRDGVPSLGSGPSEARDELTHRTARSEGLTMSSLEIAERTGKEHRNVLADIHKMFQDVGEVALKFRRYYTASNGKRNPCYHLPEIYVLTLITGYSIPLRKAVIERWRELEAQVAAPVTSAPALPDFNDPVAAARAWADAAEKQREAEKLAAQSTLKLAEARKEVKLLAAPAAVGELLARQKRSLQDIARRLPGINMTKIGHGLVAAGYLKRYPFGHTKANQLYVPSQYRDTHFQTVSRLVGSQYRTEIGICPKGFEVIAKLYLSGKFEMKKGFEDDWKKLTKSSVHTLLADEAGD